MPRSCRRRSRRRMNTRGGPGHFKDEMPGSPFHMGLDGITPILPVTPMSVPKSKGRKMLAAGRRNRRSRSRRRRSRSRSKRRRGEICELAKKGKSKIATFIKNLPLCESYFTAMNQCEYWNTTRKKKGCKKMVKRWGKYSGSKQLIKDRELDEFENVFGKRKRSRSRRKKRKRSRRRSGLGVPDAAAAGQNRPSFSHPSNRYGPYSAGLCPKGFLGMGGWKPCTNYIVKKVYSDRVAQCRKNGWAGIKLVGKKGPSLTPQCGHTSLCTAKGCPMLK